ncbi:hypothetical protein ACXHXM_34160
MADVFQGAPFSYPHGSFYQDLDERIKVLETLIGSGEGAVPDFSITNFKLAANAVTREKLDLSAIAATHEGLAGFRNKLINGNGMINQRNASTVADDVYGHDRHYALTQTAAIGVSTVLAPSLGIRSMMRLTQVQPAAQRMGYAQIVESSEVLSLRGETVTLGGKLRCSASATVRYAVLEWTGTADTVTSDVVSSWTNGAYTVGNFFISTGLVVTQVGSIALTASAITPWSITATIGNAANNLIVLVWTEAAASQNSTLDLIWYLVQGDATLEYDPFSPRHIQQELALCQRYYRRIIINIRQYAGAAGAIAAHTVTFPDMRAAPAVALLTSGSIGNAASSLFTPMSANAVRNEITATAVGDCYILAREYGLDAEL